MSLLRIFCAILLACIYCIESSAQTVEFCKDRSWLLFKNHCYSFETLKERYQEKKLDYYEAEDYCRSRGAHLVSIHSAAEYDFLVSRTYGGRRWIGLNQLQGKDQFQWSDGTDVDFIRYQSKKIYQKESCFILAKAGWKSDHCNLHNRPICKRPNSDTPPTAVPPQTTVAPEKGNCPENWIQFGEKCYKFFGDRVQFKLARNSCSNLGPEYELVSIHSPEEQAFLTQHLYDFGESAWIGRKLIESDVVGQDLVIGWVDNSRNDFSDWMQGHPPPNTWKYCGRLNYAGFGKGKWVADYCETVSYGYICQRPSDPQLPVQPSKDPKCEADQKGYRKSCYSLHSDEATFQDAEEVCQKSGGHLVSVTDSFEQAFLLNFIGGRQSATWTGLRNKENSRYFKWTNSEPLYYSNWADGQPDFSAAEQSCAFIDNSNNLKWNLTACSSKLTYVCEFSKDSPTPPPVEAEGSCPTEDSSWIDIGDDQCYHVGQSNYRVMGWGAVSRYCTMKGMKMITITSDHQQNSLASYLWRERKNVWLGMIRSFDKESFFWLDGSSVNFTSWVTDEPSSWFRDKDCASFSPVDLKWRPTDCNDAAITICQSAKKV